jgi:hypothetical protein
LPYGNHSQCAALGTGFLICAAVDSGMGHWRVHLAHCGPSFEDAFIDAVNTAGSGFNR